MGITTSNKQISIDHIDCGGALKVTLALAAAPDITTNPTDIVLILDRSGSMDGTPLEHLKLGADAFIDIIDEATDGVKDGIIGGGSHIGIVSFDGTASQDTQLITSVNQLKQAVVALDANGNTNHAAAFSAGMNLFNPVSNNARVMVMFTDGKTTAGPPPSPVAAAARAAGITIFVIGLVGDDGIDVAALNDWATDPDASHVAITPDAADLEQLFENLAKNISKPGATDIVIDEFLNPDFSIISVNAPTKGTAIMVNLQTLQWRIAELGVSGSEGATLEFFIRHTADTSGLKHVNSHIEFSDAEHNVVSFPDPLVDVDCAVIIEPEHCPDPKIVSVKGCSDAVEVDVDNVFIESQGKILEVTLRLKNVCDHKRIAVAVIVNEPDDHDEEHHRGLKIFTVPAHEQPGCRDVEIRCIKFVLPDDLDISGGPIGCNANERRFTIRVLANNVDNNFDCCGEI